jgi:hypothetical protein
MRKRLVAMTLVGLAWILPNPAGAWHRGGHMTVARIAWLQMNDQPAMQEQITAILDSHPHRDLYLLAEKPAGATKDEWMFLRAATWPDWVRDPVAPKGQPKLTPQEREDIIVGHSRPDWHFVNLPYIHPDDAGRFDGDALRKDVLVPEFDAKDQPRHALAALKRCLARLRAAQTSPADKAVCLCWVLHLVGDLHQPLHCAALIASKDRFDPPFLPPEGDRGGNRLAIMLSKTDPAAVDLHSFWDAQLFIADPPRVTTRGLEEATPSFHAVDTAAKGLLDDAGLKRDQLPELMAADTLAWADESLKAAKESAYRDGDGFLKAIRVPPGKDPLVGQNAPELSGAYREAAKMVARRRIALAGYRLADQLRVAFKAE